MFKNRLMYALVLCFMVFSLSAAMADKKNVIETKKVGDTKYTLYSEKTKFSTKYYIDQETETGVETWTSSDDQKLDSFILCINFLNNIDEFAMGTIEKYDSSKWTKVNLRKPVKEDANSGDSMVEVYAKKDAVIHITCSSEDRTCGRTVYY
ncbi:MAG: hypothetical protein IKP71_04085, partial [Candidatus Riflebacteria bacterium]|nr:hypothetical protein [Candidatus Riflebacteria bacterium]